MSSKIKILKILTIKINNKIIENEAHVGFFDKGKIPLRHFLESVKKRSQKYDVVLIKIERLHNLGWSQVQTIRRSLLTLKSESIQVYSYLESGGLKEYYLASAANEVILAPLGNLDLVGFKAEAFFLKKSLEQIGVGADFIKTGDYKTFGDMFTRDSISEPHKKMIEDILDTYMNEVGEEIKSSRSTLSSSFQDIVDQGPYTANEALETVIVDHLKYEEELEDFLKERFQAKKSIKIPLKISDSSTSWYRIFKRSKKIALIYAEGNIVEGDSKGLAVKNVISANKLVKDIRKIRKDKSIKALVLRVNSPGGSALASDIIWHELKKTKSEKPVVVSMSNVAASGGYYISMCSDAIFAESMTLSGSIGVFIGKFYSTELLNKLGINREVIMRGKKSDIYSPFNPFTKDELEKLEAQVVSFYYKQFVEKAAEGRNKDFDSMESIAQGRVWTGREGKKIGLVDEIGGLDDALTDAQNRADFKQTDKIKYLIYPKRKLKLSIKSLLQGALFSFISPFIHDLPLYDLLHRQTLNYKNEPLYMMPSILKID